MLVLRNLIGGRWREAAETREVLNPSDPATPVGRFFVATPEDVEDAVSAARTALPGWASAPAAARGTVLAKAAAELRARADELGRILSDEEDKTLPEGVGEVRRAADILDFYAQEAYRPTGELLGSSRPGVEVEVRHHPIGVVGVITPWNFPIAIPAWKVAPALAYGNAVVLKPAEQAPASAWHLADVLHRAGVPDGVLNLTIGPGSTVGSAMAEHEGIDGVTFTGSTPVGKLLAGRLAARLAKVQLELGGKNALVVLDDADLDTAVECALQGAYGSTGQRCTASSRLVVARGIHDRFVEALAARLRSLRLGAATDPEAFYGPVASGAQLEQDLGYLQVGEAEGATALVRGQAWGEGGPRVLGPTLFVGGRNDMRIAQEEIFGPVAVVIEVEGLDEALSVVNDSQYGLVASVVTRSLAAADRFKREAQVGMSMVNLPTAGQEFHAPFGGAKASSYGPREQGRAAREFFTQSRTSYVKAK